MKRDIEKDLEKCLGENFKVSFDDGVLTITDGKNELFLPRKMWMYGLWLKDIKKYFE